MRSGNFAALLFLSTGLLASTGVPGAEGEISAKVNGVAISQERLDVTFGAVLDQQRVPASALRNPGQYQELRRRVLDGLIAQELLAQEASKRGYQASDAEVQQALAQVQAGQPSRDAYLQRLAQSGFTEESYAQDLRRRLSVSQMVDKDVTGRAAVTDQEIQDYYAANQGSFALPEQVRARHILVEVDTEADQPTRDAARQKAESIAAEIKGGADFAELARKYSADSSAQEGGDLGLIARGQTVEPFEAAAFALAPGEVSGVVETQFGYHLIKVEERQGGGPMGLDQVRDELRERLVARKAQEDLHALVDRLRQGADVQVLE